MSPNGEQLEPELLASLRALISERGSRGLVEPLGVSRGALERAAAGGRVLRGTRALIATGIARMKEGKRK